MSSTSRGSAVKHLVIIGAQRCGTTYLYRLLDAHPEIEMARPMRPEPKFFLRPDAVEAGLDAYASLFGGAPGVRVRGEKGTSYIESEAAARAVAAVLPDAVIVALVRDPIERAVSNYRFTVEHGLEDLDVEEALTEEAEHRPYDRAAVSASPYAYLSRGRYVEHLETWLRHVPRESLFVGVFEELVADRATADRLCERLGVGPMPAGAPFGEVANPAVTPEATLGAPARAALRAYFEPWNRRLETFLGRPLGWS